MKLKLLACLFFLAAIQILNAQKRDSCFSGVYLNEQDYLANKLSYRINKNQKGNKIGFSFPADLTLTLKVMTVDTTIKFKPGEIYAFNDCGRIYRYSPGEELNAQEDYYKLEEAKGMAIYTSLFISGSETFYSLDLTSSIHRLTKKNLEIDFQDHPQFLKEMKKLYKNSDGDLAEKDKDGLYIINKIYQETIKPRKSLVGSLFFRYGN
jgi:hypothetical protein